MAVRERLAGDQWLLTVKTAGQSQNGLSRRHEWEGPTTPGALQFDTLVDDAALVQDLMTLRPNLRPLFCTDFERQRWVIAHAGAQIEVALDQGRIHVPGTDLSEPLLEVELELLSGPEEALMALAEVLHQTPLGSVTFLPSDVSKAQRGMALWSRIQWVSATMAGTS
jgi:inorganic triphosphatase YgiF